MSVFISYSSQDKEFARRLAGDLKNHGITVWFDETELLPGDSIIGTIEAVIDQMAFLIVVLSPRSVVSEWVTQEVRMALHNGISGKKVSVIPVLRETCQIPGFLRNLKYADMRSDPDYPASLEKLIAKINRRLEFKDDLQKLQGDLALVKESREATQDKLGPEKSHGIEQLISLVRRAIDGELNEDQWQAGIASLAGAFGPVQVTFDQQNQRVRQQINIANLTLTLPTQPTPADPEVLKKAEAAFRRRVRERFAEDARFYIPLRGETTKITADRVAGHVPHSVQRRCRRITPALREVVEEGREMRRVRLDNLREAVDKYRCVILLGDPGCGKTTVVEHLAYELAVENGLLPLPLRLGGFEPEMAVEEFIGDGWAGPESADHWNWSSPELASGLGDYLEAGKLFFLFDGLNEMPPEGYAERVRALRRFINRWSTKGNRFVVTCRVVDYGEQLTGLKRVEIQSFTDQQIKDFLRQDLPETWENLWQLLPEETNPQRSLLELARNPFNLSVMVEVFHKDGRLGSNRSELMRRFTEQLMDELAQPLCDSERWLDTEVQQAALAHLAFEMQSRPRLGTTVKKVVAESLMPSQVRLCEDVMVPSPPDQVLKLAASAHIIEMTGDRSALRFYHQLLQEYFAAREMLRRSPEKMAHLWRWPWLEKEMPEWVRPEDNYDPLPPPPPTKWEETTVMAAGLMPENDDGLVRAVTEINPVLAGRCLYEGRAEVRGETRRAVIERLLAAIADPEVALRVRIAAGETLGYLGDPRPGELVTIPEGPFLMGDDEDGDAKPRHEVFLPACKIGKFPVTNAEFREFVDAGGYREKRWWAAAGWRFKEAAKRSEPKYWGDTRFNKPNQPVVGVSWYEALAYCRWRAAQEKKNYRLPTEAEWEKAARGTDGREYPWRGAFDPSRLNSDEGDQTVQTTTPVGIYPAGVSPSGCLEMAGNVWEWTGGLWGKDWGKPEYRYPYDPADGRDNLDASDEVLRVLRGGSWNNNRDNARCSYRNSNNPNNGNDNNGFRVVVSHIFTLSAGNAGPVTAARPRSGRWRDRAPGRVSCVATRAGQIQNRPGPWAARPGPGHPKIHNRWRQKVTWTMPTNRTGRLNLKS